MKNKKTVWIVNQFAVAPEMPGGTRHFEFAREMTKKGYEVLLFASDFSLYQRRYLKLEGNESYRKENIEGVNFIWVYASPYEKNNWKRISNFVSFAFNFRKVARNMPLPDLIIGSSPQLFGAYSSYHFAKKNKVPFVLEIRDLWPQTLVDMGALKENSIQVRILRIIERALYKNSDRILIIASKMKDYLLQMKVDAEKITYLPNGIDTGAFSIKISREESRKKYGFTKFTVVYAGAHGEANALETIIRAAEITKEKENKIEFILVGDGPKKEDLKTLAASMGLDNVRLFDPLPKNEIPDLFKGADASVITLKKADLFIKFGGSPNKLFDYMGSGLPVICSVEGEVADIVRESGCGYTVEPENNKQLADTAIMMSKLSESELREIGEKGRRFVFEDYSREKISKSLLALIKEITEQGETKET